VILHESSGNLFKEMFEQQRQVDPSSKVRIICFTFNYRDKFYQELERKFSIQRPDRNSLTARYQVMDNIEIFVYKLGLNPTKSIDEMNEHMKKLEKELKPYFDDILVQTVWPEVRFSGLYHRDVAWIFRSTTFKVALYNHYKL